MKNGVLLFLALATSPVSASEIDTLEAIYDDEVKKKVSRKGPLEVPQKRISTASAGLAQSSRDYRSARMDLGLGIDHHWKFLAHVIFSKPSSTTNTTQFGAGANYRFSEDFYLGGGFLVRNEAKTIRANGIGVDMDWTVSSLWNANRTTILSIDLQVLRYSKDRTGLKAGQDAELFNQRRFSIGLEQEIVRTLIFHGSFTNYSYTQVPENFQDAINSTRPDLSTSQLTTLGLVGGFPGRNYTAGVIYQYGEFWRFNPYYSNTKLLLVNQRTQTFGAVAGHVLNSLWDFEADLSRSQTPGLPNEYLLSVLARYTWE